MKIDKQERATVKRLLGLHPIRDAVMPLRFWVKKEDIESAVPRDPQNCVLANAIARITGTKQGIAVFPTVVYVPEDKHGDGKFIISRYAARKKSHRAIGDFDRTGNFPVGEYAIFPPSKSMALATRKSRSKKDRAKWKSQGKKTVRAKTPKEPSFLEMRNGTGRVNIVGKSLIPT